MKSHHVFGVLWLLFCSFFALDMVAIFFRLYSSHKLGSPLYVCLGIIATAFLWVGIGASIFLIRGAVWAKRFIGFIAVLCLLGCAGHFLAYGYVSEWQLLESAFSLVSVFVLFDLKRYMA
jgi:hypothetical protein